ncbi:uncharacterized protein KY384_008744 [Bacidia gigantensis]|uniref:uncharacterized protein n=1 Tax=Bacidia gigantensis TaxID=2732470 RepID=UPI001D039341|nr:uncharacterized protein KY384_008744 [Bacidia gigantensis]KAG8526543.1 hypothetical protein KY384_008744 [Bacidia gigantensis]
MARAYQERHILDNLSESVKNLQAQANDLTQAKHKQAEQIKNLITSKEALEKRNTELELRVKANEHNAVARTNNSHLAQSANPNHTTLTPLHDVGTNRAVRQFPKHERDIKTMAQHQVIQILQALDVKVLGLGASEKKAELRACIGLPKEPALTWVYNVKLATMSERIGLQVFSYARNTETSKNGPGGDWKRVTDFTATNVKTPSESTKSLGTSSKPTKWVKIENNHPKTVKKANMTKDTEDSEEGSTSSDSSEEEKLRLKKRTKRKADSKTKSKNMKKPSKKAKADTTDSDSSSSEGEVAKAKVAKKEKVKSRKSKDGYIKAKKAAVKNTLDTSSSNEKSSDSEDDTEESQSDRMETPVGSSATVVVSHNDPLKCAISQLEALRFGGGGGSSATTSRDRGANAKKTGSDDSVNVAKGSKPEFVRLDKVWSQREYRFIKQPSTQEDKLEKYEEYAFNVVRRMDHQNRYLDTSLHILSKPLKHALFYVMGTESGISLEVDKPAVNPNMVFLYLEELRAYRKGLKMKIEQTRKKAIKAKLQQASKHLKVLIDYLDKDYEETKKTLYPLLEKGRITFDLVWALFKSNDIVYTSTYGHDEQPRAAKVAYVSKEKSLLQGEYYDIDTRFLDNDGKRFGIASTTLDIKHFSGVRPITSLTVYPLKYHPQHEQLKQTLIERGKKFVALKGKQYKAQKGIAYYKGNCKIIKVFVNGRVMIDPATFRRLRPNYPFSNVKPPDKDIIDDPASDAEVEEINETSSSSDDRASQSDPLASHSHKKKKKPKRKLKAFQDPDDPDEVYYVEVTVDESEQLAPELEDLPLNNDRAKSKSISQQKATTTDEPAYTFTDTDYLIASPVTLGFSFSEKLWLEFAVSGISDIQWNDSAFDNLILPDDQKTIVKALVESHEYEGNNNIDDVIQGKGRGLVAVLHGPPGTGKTLTAEGIAELLRKPLYAVSVGELGIKGGDVEHNLTTILDVAHTWGAILLLDEADVFLEARTNYDLGRNALVSIFLRMLEYFQGILFLTTNRVQCFDPAFTSRIHIGLRYGELDIKTRKAIWRLFIEKVRALGPTSPDAPIITAGTPAPTNNAVAASSSTVPVKSKADAKEPARRSHGVEPGAFGDEDMKRLASYELNGREIKNAVRTAQSVALISGEKLGMKHMLQVLAVGNVFAKDLKGAGYEEAMKFYM